MAVSQSAPFVASLRYAHATYAKAFTQLAVTMALFVTSIGLMFASLDIHYGLTLALSLFATVAYLRLFMIGHDCSHSSFLPKKWQNDLLGKMIGVMTLTPFRFWAKQHARHHSTTGNLDRRGNGDVYMLTVNEYASAGWRRRLAYRFYRNFWFMLLVSAPVNFLILHRLPLGDQMRTLQGWLSVMGTNIGIACYYGSLIWAFGLQSFVMVYAPVVMLSSAGAVWLFYVQHQFADAYWQNDDAWTYEQATLKGSSYYDLPTWMHWATGNIGYHHIHHLNPRVPNYELPECFDNSPTLQDAKHLSLSESLMAARLALWDETRQRLISFREYGELRRSAA